MQSMINSAKDGVEWRSKLVAHIGAIGATGSHQKRRVGNCGPGLCVDCQCDEHDFFHHGRSTKSGMTAPHARVTPAWFFCGQSAVRSDSQVRRLDEAEDAAGPLASKREPGKGFSDDFRAGHVWWGHLPSSKQC
jgi:hypothetical protein